MGWPKSNNALIKLILWCTIRIAYHYCYNLQLLAGCILRSSKNKRNITDVQEYLGSHRSSKLTYIHNLCKRTFSSVICSSQQRRSLEAYKVCCSNNCLSRRLEYMSNFNSCVNGYSYAFSCWFDSHINRNWLVCDSTKYCCWRHLYF